MLHNVVFIDVFFIADSGDMYGIIYVTVRYFLFSLEANVPKCRRSETSKQGIAAYSEDVQIERQPGHTLKVHKRENFFGSYVEFFTFLWLKGKIFDFGFSKSSTFPSFRPKGWVLDRCRAFDHLQVSMPTSEGTLTDRRTLRP
jgi:hypothetical protein